MAAGKPGCAALGLCLCACCVLGDVVTIPALCCTLHGHAQCRPCRVPAAAGRYLERLVITQPVSITAAPGAAVEVAWQTGAPYEAAVEVLGVRQPDAVLLRGLRIRHSSKSVANNYAVRLEGCDATLLDCDVSSASGDGVGIEGGAPRLLRCAVHDCQRHGEPALLAVLGRGWRLAACGLGAVPA